MIQTFFHFISHAPKDSLFPFWWFSWSTIGWLTFSLSIILYRPKGERIGAILLGLIVMGILGPLGAILGPMCLILHHPEVSKEMGDYAKKVANRTEKGIE